MSLAQEEGKVLNHNYIGTEHLLLGLMDAGEGIAYKALVELGIDMMAFREKIEEVIGKGPVSQTGHIPFTARTKRVLEFSLREALQLGHNYIGTEHILLSLLKETEGVAAVMLKQEVGDLAVVRKQIVSMILTPTTTESSSHTPASTPKMSTP